MLQEFEWLHRLLYNTKHLANLRILKCTKCTAIFDGMITLLCYEKVNDLHLHFEGDKMKAKNKKI